MKIIYEKVVEANRATLKRYIPEITPSDDLPGMQHKAQGRIKVQSSEDAQPQITVTFICDLVVAVSKAEPSAETLEKALSSFVTGAASGAGAVINGIYVKAVGDLIKAAGEILRTPMAPGFLAFSVPVADVKPTCSYTVTAVVHAVTITQDTPPNEIADMGARLRWVDQYTAPKHVITNHGEETVKWFPDEPMVLKNQTGSGTVDTAVNVDYTVITDGAKFSNPISAIAIYQVELSFREECGSQHEARPPAEQPRRPPEESQRPPEQSQQPPKQPPEKSPQPPEYRPEAPSQPQQQAGAEARTVSMPRR